MKSKRKLIRRQLDASLQKYRPLMNVSVPSKGWVRALRDALGMTGTQLAARLQITKQRVSMLEQDEVSGSATIKKMRQAAEALDCVFVYAVVPKTSLERIVADQAERVARKRLDRIAHSMSLEQQELSNDEQERAIEDEKESIINNARILWGE